MMTNTALQRQTAATTEQSSEQRDLKCKTNYSIETWFQLFYH